MNQIKVHYTTKENVNLFYLAQHVEWRFDDKDILFYNILFDSVVIAKPKSRQAGIAFVHALESGCDDVMDLIEETFDQNPQAVYSLMVNKKIIE